MVELAESDLTLLLSASSVCAQSCLTVLLIDFCMLSQYCISWDKSGYVFKELCIFHLGKYGALLYQHYRGGTKGGPERMWPLDKFCIFDG